MASVAAVGDEGFSDEASSDEGFTEFEDIQRALAQESGEEVGQETAAVAEEPGIEALFEGGIDSSMLEAEREAEISEEEVEAPAKKTRADKRIQGLISEKKKLQAQMAERDASYQRQLQGVQHQLMAQKQADSDAMRQQLELQRQQLALMQQQKRAEAESNLSPMEQYRRQIIQEAGETARGAVSPEVAALRDEITAMKQQRQQEAEEATRRQRYDQYNRQTTAVRDGMLLKGFAPDRAKQLAEPMDEMLLAFCTAFGVEPEAAGPQFKRYLDTYVQGVLETRASSGQKMRKGQAVPRAAPGGKRAVRGSGKWPAPDSLRKAGFDSALDWVAAGEPPIA